MTPATSRELTAAKFRAVGAVLLAVLLAIADAVVLVVTGAPE